MLTRMLKLASCSAGLLLGVLLAMLSGCAGSSGGCTSCGSHGGAGPIATAPYPGVPAAYAAVAPAVMPTQVPGGSTMPYGNQSAAPNGGQRTCPVTGEELGSMGPAIPVAVNGQTIYVCCEGCVQKVQRNPDSFIAKVIKERAGQ